MKSSHKNVVIGLMSGTSLDGIDLCACSFEKVNDTIKYKIIAAETVDYTSEWMNTLSNQQITGQELIKTHHQLGDFLGEKIIKFIDKYSLQPDLIASHGNTLYHQPNEGYTFQLGAGANIAAITGVDTICDFRSMDVALGGQGAPLVPIGDQLLFNQFEACLNLGGIANISFQRNEKRNAFDICPVNMALNYLAGKLNLKYDHKGELAAQGEINNPLLEQLNALPFYQQEGPKSLGKEWFDKNFLPLLNRPEDKSEDAISNTLRTVTEHIALQHASVLKKTNIKGPVLLTGGGAFNEFLVNRLKAVCDAEIHIPDADVINFKEAIIFALLGWLYSRNEINTLSSATGSKRNSIGGALYKGL